MRQCGHGTDITLRTAQPDIVIPGWKFAADAEDLWTDLLPVKFDYQSRPTATGTRTVRGQVFYLKTYQFSPRYYPRGYCGARHQRYGKDIQSLGYYQGMTEVQHGSLSCRSLLEKTSLTPLTIKWTRSDWLRACRASCWRNPSTPGRNYCSDGTGPWILMHWTFRMARALRHVACYFRRYQLLDPVTWLLGFWLRPIFDLRTQIITSSKGTKRKKSG